MSRSPLVIDLNLSTDRRCASQERKIPLPSGLNREKPKAFPASVSPHFHCKADQLVASLQLSLAQATEHVSSLTLEKSLLERELSKLKSVLDDKSFSKRESASTAATSLTPETSLSKLVADCKAQEDASQAQIKDLRHRMDSKSRKIRGLEDELRASRKELEAAQRSNRLLRIELTATKEALSASPSADTLIPTVELSIARQKLSQIDTDLSQLDQQRSMREKRLMDEIDTLKEKQRKLQDELIQNESMLFICRIELNARH